ncbi:immune inhibitor A domain-containing protein [Aliikangiella maris]|uniref:Immune inhibitor A domain-containing protein n=2 Tax=Aliikangiella maris TaxID=3162458 RepID=A0ABV3MLN7_9GAMM
MIKLKNFFAQSVVAASLAATLSITTVNAKPERSLSLRDPGTVNQERILYWLKKRGELSENATYAEQQAALTRFIKPETLSNQQYINRLNGKLMSNLPMRSSHAGHAHAGHTKNAQAVPHEVKVLTILIDFPDLPHDDNRLTASDTNMYYASYPKEHYQDLMFSPTGFTGPSGQNLQSSRQYYSAESGGEFVFNGTVYGWVTADKNASEYGANDPDNNDSDINTVGLIKEAVTKAVAEYGITLSDFDRYDPTDLNKNGILDEPDGYIDYLMVFHSSIGEDAGGGVLGTDAIWSHRWNVNNYLVPGGDGIRAHDYTVQPIDAAIGVVSHEFGHMVANLPDEYDTNNNEPGSPVGTWSIMASGSWAGTTIPGAMPTGFSPQARETLQQKFGGKWINQQTIELADLEAGDQTIDLVEAVKHDSGINQVKINLPKPVSIFNPSAGNYFYYSKRGDSLNNTAKFNLTIPTGSSHTLTMKAQWDIEKDWDYAQILIDGVAVAGNHTIATNPIPDQYPSETHYQTVTNYLSEKSSKIGENWVDLTFDLSAYNNQTVEVTIKYYTDANTGGYGIMVDSIALNSDGNSVIVADTEVANSVTLAGFERISQHQIIGEDQNYYIQLRSHNSVDAGLKAESYDHGVLMWFANKAFYNNESSVHPGEGFLSVIDADQNIISDATYGIWWTYNQIRDAIFSLYAQSEKAADSNLQAISIFDDSFDYSTPEQPESGVVLPINGLKMEVLSQETDSTTAQIKLSLAGELTASFTVNKTGLNATFSDTTRGGKGNRTYSWDFGDGNTSSEASPSHTYAQSGSYTVALSVTDGENTTSTYQLVVDIQAAAAPVASFTSTKSNLTVNLTNTSTDGEGTLSYAWDFGDGSTSTNQSPSHTYAAAGTYTITLVVTDSLNRTSESSASVTVSTPPAPPPAPEEKSGGGGSMGLLFMLFLALLKISTQASENRRHWVK